MEKIHTVSWMPTDEDCIAAAKLANADGFIRMLAVQKKMADPGQCSKATGSGLSPQGQASARSRLARAMPLTDPPVMILDEATSSSRYEEHIPRS